MKKIIMIFCVAFVLVACSGCENQLSDEKITINEDMQDNNVEVTEQTLEKRIHNEKKKFAKPELPTDNVYINSECGYKFEFPKEWIGWYFISEHSPDYVTVRFYGKSIRGTVAEKYISEKSDYGLKLFFIMSEQKVLEGEYDSVTLLGNVNGVNYYYATTTDVSLAPLLGEGKFWFDEDETEQQLMENDWNKACEMLDFCKSSDNLKKAFSKI